MINWGALTQTTLRDPREAARQIMALDLGRDALWTALALVAVVNAIVLQLLVSGVPPEVQAQFPGYFASPLVMFMLLIGVMVIYIHTVYWSGLSLGGEGRLYDVVALLVWLQVLRTVVQLFVLLLTLTVPSLAGLASLAAFAVAFWILINFVAEALSLPSLGHAIMALAVAVVGLVLGLGILLAIISIAATGTMSHV